MMTMHAVGVSRGRAPALLDRTFAWLYGDLPASDRFRVAWLSGTLFFIMGG